jgi:hypothetical protein
MHIKLQLINLKGRTHMVDLGIDGRIKMERKDVLGRGGFMCVGVGTRGAVL